MTETTKNGNGRLRLDTALVLQVIAWIVAVLLAYGMVRSDVEVLKSRQHESERRIQRIEDKVDDVLDILRNRP